MTWIQGPTRSLAPSQQNSTAYRLTVASAHVTNTTNVVTVSRPYETELVQVHAYLPALATFDIQAGTWTTAAVNMTSVDAANDAITIASHGYATGDGPYQLTTSGTLPAGLATSTDYWVYVVNDNSFKLSTSAANAKRVTKQSGTTDVANPLVVDITDTGTGTHTVGSAMATIPASSDVDYDTPLPIRIGGFTDATMVNFTFTCPERISIRPSATGVRVQLVFG